MLTGVPPSRQDGALPMSYTGAVLTGLEPAISTVTGWRALQLLCKTMVTALWHLDSNQEGRINSPRVYR